MWSISALEPADKDLHIRRTTKPQDGRLDARTRQQGGQRKRSRVKHPGDEESLEVDVFEHRDAAEDQS